VTPVSRDVLAAMAETVSPQGVIGVAPLLDVPLERALEGGARLVAVLEAVNDPGNAGTGDPHRRRRRRRRRGAHRRLHRPARRQVRARHRRQPVAPAGGVRCAARGHGPGAGRPPG
jgi:hypothetical protein